MGKPDSRSDIANCGAVPGAIVGLVHWVTVWPVWGSASVTITVPPDVPELKKRRKEAAVVPAVEKTVPWRTTRPPLALKRAATTALPVKVTLQDASVALGHPLQPANTLPCCAAADKTTVCPLVNVDTQVAPQLIPLGLLVTVPPGETLRESCAVLSEFALAVKVAVTTWFEVMVMAHVVEVRLTQSPVHPVKFEPAAGVATTLTTVPGE